MQHRRVVCGAELTLWASFRDLICPCEYGDKVLFPCGTRPTQRGKTYVSGWASRPREEDLTTVMVEGRVGPMWFVTPGEEQGEEQGLTEQ